MLPVTTDCADFTNNLQMFLISPNNQMLSFTRGLDINEANLIKTEYSAYLVSCSQLILVVKPRVHWDHNIMLYISSSGFLKKKASPAPSQTAPTEKPRNVEGGGDILHLYQRRY